MKTTHSDPDDADDYEVGYGKPPKHTQFPKGQSGNPKGRAKKLKNLDELLAKALVEEVKLNGKTITKQEFLVEALIQHSAKGKPAAMQIMFARFAALSASGSEEFDPLAADQVALAKYIKSLPTDKSNPNDNEP